jgi:hypothetical protein
MAPTISTHFMLVLSARKLSAGPDIFPQNLNFDFTLFKMGGEREREREREREKKKKRKKKKERKRERTDQLLLHILTLLSINVLHLKFLCT